jgi:hypothetical protein
MPKREVMAWSGQSTSGAEKDVVRPFGGLADLVLRHREKAEEYAIPGLDASK